MTETFECNTGIEPSLEVEFEAFTDDSNARAGGLDKVEADLDEERGWTRIREDYIHRLRQMLADLGAVPPPWPVRHEGG